jgi:hypothetical protein
MQPPLQTAFRPFKLPFKPLVRPPFTLCKLPFKLPSHKPPIPPSRFEGRLWPFCGPAGFTGKVRSDSSGMRLPVRWWPTPGPSQIGSSGVVLGRVNVDIQGARSEGQEQLLNLTFSVTCQFSRNARLCSSISYPPL